MLELFGAQPSPSDIEKYASSPQWNGIKFENIEPTKSDVSFFSLPAILHKQFENRENRQPHRPLPVIAFDRNKFCEAGEEFRAIWFGHSAILMRMANTSIFIDPMLGPNAAPISPLPAKRFSENVLAVLDEIPELDLVVLSHDHYDHLDYASIQKLKDKTKYFFVALGVGRHLEKWGIDKDIITEFDWWDAQLFNNIRITFTPTRHFSGRGLTDHSKSLWGGWVFTTTTENIWFSGDGGYGEHFKEIGQLMGPFDFAFVECGQYSEFWPQIHMFPEESVQAVIDAGTRKVMPVHWAGFALSQHSWTNPADRFVSEAEKRELNYVLPGLGEPITLHFNERLKWWISGL
jgi:L-ascorbate metabolism protein UlaG (beta-lactamase superfamily)